jgi:hypothetical protein
MYVCESARARVCVCVGGGVLRSTYEQFQGLSRNLVWILYHWKTCQLLNFLRSVIRRRRTSELVKTGMTTATLNLRPWNWKKSQLFTVVFLKCKIKQRSHYDLMKLVVAFRNSVNALIEKEWMWGAHVLCDVRTKLSTFVSTSETHQETESTFTAHASVCVKARFFIKWQHIWRKILGPDISFL